MKATIIKYGVISGIIVAILMFVVALTLDKVGYGYGETIGYASMIIGFLPIFLGARKYRDTIGEGYISFGRATALCTVMALLANLFYVAAWLYIYYNMPDVMTKYSAYVISQMKATGSSQQDINTMLQNMQHAKEMFQNPLLNAINTYAKELFGSLLFSVISGLLLRKKPPALGLN